MNLPNGAQLKVTNHGKLRISKDLVLNRVLHVPNFKLIFGPLKDFVNNQNAQFSSPKLCVYYRAIL